MSPILSEADAPFASTERSQGDGGADRSIGGLTGSLKTGLRRATIGSTIRRQPNRRARCVAYPPQQVTEGRTVDAERSEVFIAPGTGHGWTNPGGAESPVAERRAGGLHDLGNRTPLLPEVPVTSALSWRLARASALVGLLLVLGSWGAAQAQNTPEQQAAMLLDQRPQGVQREELPLRRHPLPRVPPEVRQPQGRHAARYGLALSPARGRAAQLRPGAASSSTSWPASRTSPTSLRPVLHSAWPSAARASRRWPGRRPSPTRPATHQATARSRFEEAAKQFGAAVDRVRRPRSRTPRPGRRTCRSTWSGPPAAAATRPRCCCACGKAKEAQEAVARSLDRTSYSRRAAIAALGLYYHGFASFLLGDHAAAGKSLTR